MSLSASIKDIDNIVNLTLLDPQLVWLLLDDDVDIDVGDYVDVDGDTNCWFFYRAFLLTSLWHAFLLTSLWSIIYRVFTYVDYIVKSD